MRQLFGNPRNGYELEPLEQALYNTGYCYCRDNDTDEKRWFVESPPMGWHKVPLEGYGNHEYCDPIYREELRMSGYNSLGFAVSGR